MQEQQERSALDAIVDWLIEQGVDPAQEWEINDLRGGE